MVEMTGSRGGEAPPEPGGGGSSVRQWRCWRHQASIGLRRWRRRRRCATRAVRGAGSGRGSQENLKKKTWGEQKTHEISFGWWWRVAGSRGEGAAGAGEGGVGGGGFTSDLEAAGSRVRLAGGAWRRDLVGLP